MKRRKNSIFSRNFKVPTIILKSFSDCLHTSNSIFQSEETTWRFQKDRCYRLWEIFLSCHASTGFVEKGIPRVFQLSFTIQPGFLLLPSHRTHTRDRSKLAGRHPHERGLPFLHTNGYESRKAASRMGNSPVCMWRC